MTISTEEKKALRRYMADNSLSRQEVAEIIGVSNKTIESILKSPEPSNVQERVHKKVMAVIGQELNELKMFELFKATFKI